VGAKLQAERDAAAAEQQRARAERKEQRRKDLEAQGIDPNWSLIDQVRGALQLDGIDLADKLAEHGYEMNEAGHYRHPGSSSGSFGLKIMESADGVERAYSLNATDPLHADNLQMAGLTSRAADVVDVITVLEHDGNQGAALCALATQYGIGRDPAADFTAGPEAEAKPAGDDPLGFNPDLLDLDDSETWENLEFPPATRLLGDFIQLPTKVFIVGKTGLGKSQLAYGMAVGSPQAAVSCIGSAIARPER
jgi:hypothetical protein